MKFIPVLLVGFGLLAASLAPSHAADKSIIVFDASGSMWAQIDGKARIEIAKETVRSVIGSLPADAELGLMAYGHRDKGSCTDIELLVPPAAGTGPAIIAATDKINPKGKTPLSEAVKRAAGELKYTEEKATVILVTDGLETCNADPCALGTELEKTGVDFTAHVVGFGLSAEEGKKVACLAENTGGKYFQASDAKSLSEALTQVVVKAPEPAKPEFNFVPTIVMAEGGAPLASDAGNAWEIAKANPDGSRGEPVGTEYNAYKGALEPGDYIVEARLGEAKTEQKITIEASKVAAPQFVLNAGTLKITPKASASEPPSDAAAVVTRYPGGETTTYGPSTIVVPAGESSVTVKLGAAEVSETIQVAAGQVVAKDIIAGTGRVIANALYVDGMRIDSPNLFLKIGKAPKKIDGTYDEKAYGYGPDQKFDLPTGDYVLLIEIDGAKAEAPFSVKAGDQMTVNTVINAGIVAVKAPGYDGWEIAGAKKAIDGSRQKFHYGYGPEFQSTLLAGDYVIISRKPDGSGEKETPVTVKAGERLEVTVQ